MGKVNKIFNDKKYNLLGLYGGCALVGLFTGLVVVGFRVCLKLAERFRTERYRGFIENFSLNTTFLWILYFLIVSVVLHFILKKYPSTRGGGIPIARAYLLKQLDFTWPWELLSKFVGSLLTIGNGLSLGRKGPCILMGAQIGDGLHRSLKRKEYEKQYFVSCGAAAGISASFSAPLAGVIFSLEQMNRFFSPTLVVCVMIASVMGDLVTRGLFGLHPAFIFELTSSFQLVHYPTIIILALISSGFGILFNKSFVGLKTTYQKIWLHPIFKFFSLFLLAFFIGVMYTKYLGLGYSLANSLFKSSFPYRLLLLFLFVKFTFTLVCSVSGLPGGIFLPLLLIGSLIGRIYGEVVFSLTPLDRGYVIYFVILGMASFFTAVVRTPITASVLMLELTGSFEHLFPIIVVSMVAFLMTEIAGTGSIYDILLEDVLKNQKKIGNKDKKLTIFIPVAANSFLDGRSIKDANWPKGSLVVCIIREEKEFIPNGRTIIERGDVLTLLIDEGSAYSAKMELFRLGEEQIKKSQNS